MSYGFMVTQMMEHEGKAKHGEKVVGTLMKEHTQLDEFNVFKPLDAASLTMEEKAWSLQVLNILKEKRDGALKGWTCVVGRPQQSHISKEESAPPTCSNNALTLMLIQAAHEWKRDPHHQ